VNKRTPRLDSTPVLWGLPATAGYGAALISRIV